MTALELRQPLPAPMPARRGETCSMRAGLSGSDSQQQGAAGTLRRWAQGALGLGRGAGGGALAHGPLKAGADDWAVETVRLRSMTV